MKTIFANVSFIFVECLLDDGPIFSDSRNSIVSIKFPVQFNIFSVKRFFKLLFRWKGSVWKLVYVEVGVWLVATIIWLFIYGFLSKESVLFKKTCNKFILEIIVTYNFNVISICFI